MPTPIINSFNAGILSPWLDGRTDLEKYFAGCKDVVNFIPRPYGGAAYRTGTEYIAEVKTSAAQTRLISFEFNVNISYIIEAGDQYFRFIRDGVQIERGGSPYEIATPYLTAELDGLRFTQSADVMYIVHPNHEPRKLSRTADDSWTLAEVEFEGGPFLDENTDETITITPSYPAWATATAYSVGDVVTASDSALNFDATIGASQNLDAAAAVDKGGGLVGIPVTGHGYSAGEYVTIARTTNYNGTYLLDSTTSTNELVITETYNAETFAGSETVIQQASAVNKGLGLVGIAITAHGYDEDDIIIIAGTTNYDGQYAVQASSSADELVILATWVIEVFDGTETSTRISFYKAQTDHTSGAGNPTPPGNTTDWALAETFTGSNMTLTASSSIFDADHVGSIWKITHPRDDSSLSGHHNAAYVSSAISKSIRVFSDWEFRTSGTWSGVLEIERSFNDGATWENIRHYQSSNDANFNSTGTEEEINVLYRIKISSLVGGVITWTFQTFEYYTNGIVEITAVASGTSVTATVVDAIGRVTPTSKWSEGAWSDYRGWPRTIDFFEERLAFGGSEHKPITVWLSKTADFENMRAGTLDDDAMIYTLNGDRVNEIQWIEQQEALMIGTAGAEWRLGASDREDPLTPTNVVARRQSTYGSAEIAAVSVNDVILFIERNERKVRELVFSIEKDSYVAPDLTILSNEVTTGGITEIAYMKSPDPILWCVRADGKLLGMTYERTQDVVCWHLQETDGDVESIAVVPSVSSYEDELYMIVERTIDGNTVRYIERKRPQEETPYTWHVDCALEFNGGAAVDITGITNANPAVVSSTGHGLTTGDNVKITGVLGMTEANDIFEVVVIDPNSYSLKDKTGAVAINSTGWGTYTSGGTGQQYENTFSGLDHLEGETVTIQADGATVADEVVTSGSITIDEWANRAIVGLPYTGYLRPMRIEAGSMDGGTGQGKTKRISKLSIRFKDSIHCKVGETLTDTEIVPFRDASMSMDSRPDTFTGDKKIMFPGSHSTDGYYYIIQDEPLPLNILSVVVELETRKL